MLDVYSGSDDTAWIRATYGTTTSVEIGAHSAAAYLSSGTGDDIRISPAGSTKLIVKVDGKIGIGTIAPDNILHVYSSASAMIKLQSATGNNDIGIDFYRGTDLKWEIRNNGNDDSLFFIPQGQNDADTKLAIKSDGNVGIGTIAPASKLHVYDNITDEYVAIIDNDQANAGHGLKVTSDGNGAGSNILEVESASTSLFRVKGDGKVGIGTATPAKPVHVNVETGWATLRLEGASDSGGEIEFYKSSTKSGSIFFSAAGDCQIRPLGVAEKFIILANGNVGIGTAAPLAKLHLKGSTATNEASHILFENTQGAKKFAVGGGGSGVTNNGLGFRNVTDNTLPMIIDDSGKVGIGTNAPGEKLDVNGKIQIRGGNWLIFRNSNNSNYGSMRGASDTSNDVTINTNGEVIRFKQDGKVGIGTATPDTRLQIVDSGEVSLSVDSSHSVGSQISLNATGTGGAEWRIVSSANGAGIGGADFGLYGNSAYRFIVQADGKVGIGTNAPATKLHVRGAYSSGTIPHIRSEDSTDSSFVQMYMSNSSGGYLETSSGKMLRFAPAGSTKMVILTDGKVGIGVIPATDWDSAHEAIQLGLTASLFSGGAATGWTQLMKNGRYVGGGVYKYITTDEATRYNQKNDGTHHFDVAPSGAANAAITFTTALSILNDGTLDLKSAKFKINGSAGS